MPDYAGVSSGNPLDIYPRFTSTLSPSSKLEGPGSVSIITVGLRSCLPYVFKVDDPGTESIFLADNVSASFFDLILEKYELKVCNPTDSFCYICGKMTMKSQRRAMTALVKKAYELYFGCKLDDQDKAWTPHIVALSVQLTFEHGSKEHAGLCHLECK